MTRLDPAFLSRIQFAWVIGWHILLPAFTVGLASFIAFLEGAYALTKRPVFLHLSQFWLRIFAISFGMGVVTGIVMPFQFGTNWSRFSDAAGNVISPLLAYEGLTASSSKRHSSGYFCSVENWCPRLCISLPPH